MKRVVLAGLLLAWLAPMTAMSRDPVEIEPARSQARFSVQLRLGPATEGLFGTVGGRLQPVADDAWQVQVQIEAGTLSIEGPDWLEKSTRSEKFLAVDSHPHIRFTSAAFPEALLKRGGELRGTLELRGQSREVAFRLARSRCPRPGLDCAIHVSGSIDRTAFGMRSQRWLLRDQVGFDFRVRLRDQPPP